jgi:hypothetical protein
VNIIDAQVDEVLADHRLKRYLVGRARLHMTAPAIELHDGDNVPGPVADLFVKAPIHAVHADGPYLARLSKAGIRLCQALRARVLGGAKESDGEEA